MFEMPQTTQLKECKITAHIHLRQDNNKAQKQISTLESNIYIAMFKREKILYTHTKINEKNVRLDVVINTQNPHLALKATKNHIKDIIKNQNLFLLELKDVEISRR